MRVGRRLYDCCGPPRLEGPRTRPWLLHGREAAAVPTANPSCPSWRTVEPVGWVSDRVTTGACALIAEQPGPRGTLARDTTPR
ncbi:DUF6098 family protein [Streptomyces collinus]|uniref:DUF6098 family protein n=1 Tax=Streptomyces collinus TaxID=42684 RepID=UPI002351DE5B|nr:DUF6098 family protein [Streptomyces collinus]